MAPQQMQLVQVTSASPPAQSQMVRELLREYGEFLQARPEAAHVCFGSLDREPARLPVSYEEQGGGALLAIADDHPAGLVAWRIVPGPFSGHAWAIKRLWV